MASDTIQAICSIVLAIASGFTVYFAYKTAKISHLKMTADQKSAVDAIRHSENQARQRAIVDLIIAQKTNPEFVRQSKLVRDLRDNKNICIATLVQEKDNPTKDAILSVLNQIEFISVGIRLGVFDENMYKQLSCNSVIKTWESASGFVCELRKVTGIQTLFQDLEILVSRWKANPIEDLKKEIYK